jgi:hypothetical protein
MRSHHYLEERCQDCYLDLFGAARCRLVFPMNIYVSISVILASAMDSHIFSIFIFNCKQGGVSNAVVILS